MDFKSLALALIVLILYLPFPASGQSTGPDSAATEKSAKKNKKAQGPGKEMASGGGDVAKGAAKGAGDLAKGTAGGVGDLATGHPVDATVSVGKGAGKAAEHVGVGTVKGGVKTGKGIGGLLHHHHKSDNSRAEEPSGQ